MALVPPLPVDSAAGRCSLPTVESSWQKVRARHVVAVALSPSPHIYLMQSCMIGVLAGAHVVPCARLIVHACAEP